MRKWLVGWPLLPEILGQSDRVGAKSPIFDLFSLVAPQPYDLAKKVQLILIGSPLRAFQWAQDGHCTLSLSPERVSQKRTVSKIWTISCYNTETTRGRIGSRMRAFDWYLSRWPWMTLSGAIALILRFFTEFDCFAGQLRHSGWRRTYNVRKILSPIYSLPFLVITNPPCNAVSLR